jgi:hypothetical protein
VLLDSESALPLGGSQVCQCVLLVKARRMWIRSNGGITVKERNRITCRKTSPSDSILRHKSHTNRPSTKPGFRSKRLSIGLWHGTNRRKSVLNYI